MRDNVWMVGNPEVSIGRAVDHRLFTAHPVSQLLSGVDRVLSGRLGVSERL